MIHTIQPGDCILSIAAQYGFDWHTIWEHSQNAKLKSLRKTPNVLMVGDEVHVPDLVPKTQTAPVDKRHRFVRKKSTTEFRLRILHDGQPLKNKHYDANLDGRLLPGSTQDSTDDDGNLKLRVPPDAQQLTITIREPDFTESYVVMLGHLNPTSDITGVQQRLKNLGCGCQVTGELDRQTRDALSYFVVAFDQGDDVELTDELRRKIERVHGL